MWKVKFRRKYRSRWYNPRWWSSLDLFEHVVDNFRSFFTSNKYQHVFSFGTWGDYHCDSPKVAFVDTALIPKKKIKYQTPTRPCFFRLYTIRRIAIKFGQVKLYLVPTCVKVYDQFSIKWESHENTHKSFGIWGLYRGQGSYWCHSGFAKNIYRLRLWRR